MKKLFTLLLLAIFSLTIFASPVFADRGSRYSGRSGGHSGYSSHYSSGHRNSGYNRHHSSGHGHSSHNHINGWEAAAIGFGAAVVGSAIINSYPRERVTVVERNVYYAPPPPPCRDYYYDYPVRYVPPARVWVPGHYEWAGEGYYRRVPGYWE